MAASLISPWLLWWPPAESHYNIYDHSVVGYVSHAHSIVLLYSVGNKITTTTYYYYYYYYCYYHRLKHDYKSSSIYSNTIIDTYLIISSERKLPILLYKDECHYNAVQYNNRRGQNMNYRSNLKKCLRTKKCTNWTFLCIHGPQRSWTLLESSGNKAGLYICKPWVTTQVMHWSFCNVAQGFSA